MIFDRGNQPEGREHDLGVVVFRTAVEGTDPSLRVNARPWSTWTDSVSVREEHGSIAR